MGAVKQSRDSEFQAIMPIRGKILNCLKADYARIFKSEIITDLIRVMGCGVELGGSHNKDLASFNLDNLRFNKVVICTDADVDGSHIRILMLTFFYRYMRPLIEQGHVYAAQPPLYKVTYQKTERYCYSDAELDKVMTEIGREKKPDVQRYKGLGEMSAEQLWTTTMIPETRTMLRVTVEDAIAADEIMSLLMGEKVEPRREFIEQNSKLVLDLDI